MYPQKLDAAMKSSDLALDFVGRINNHDVNGLVELMTTDHLFVDSLGNQSRRPNIETGWKDYFEMVPDYWIKIERTVADGNIAILVGRAGGTYVPQAGIMRPENRWETPAVWVSRVKGRKIVEWRIYCDNEPIREKMRGAH